MGKIQIYLKLLIHSGYQSHTRDCAQCKRRRYLVWQLSISQGHFLSYAVHVWESPGSSETVACVNRAR